MPVATFPLGPLETNSYLLHNADQAVAVDVGGDPAPMLDYLRKHKLALAAICITHRHFDHLYGVATLEQATDAPVYVPKGDDSLAGTESSQGGLWGFPPVPPFSCRPMPEGEVSFGGMDCRVLNTPGQTPGGVSSIFPAKASSLRVTPYSTAPWAARIFPAATTPHCCIPCGRCSSNCPTPRASFPVTARPPASATKS